MSRLPHVLAVNHTSQLGGAEFSLETLVERMPSSRCRYTVALPGPGPFADRLREKHIDVDEVRLESWRWWVRSARERFKFFVTSALQVLSVMRWLFYLKRLQPDLIHLNLSRLFEPLLAARLLGIPVVAHFRDIPSQMRYRFVFGARGFYRVMNLADAWIANSSATTQDIQGHCRVPLHTIPNGLDLDGFDRRLAAEQSQAASLLRPVRHHVAMLAGLNSWKRQDEFIAMAIRVLGERRDTVFYLAGAEVDHTYVRSLREAVARAGVSDSVRFLGHLECAPSFLGLVDIMVHTTPQEPFGRVFLEAMAAGKPVVACNSGGAAEIVVDGVTGILVPFGATDQLAATVNTLLDGEARRREMGAAGRRRVEALYTVDRHCAAVAAVYDAIAIH